MFLDGEIRDFKFSLNVVYSSLVILISSGWIDHTSQLILVYERWSVKDPVLFS